jgi:hypothetical protein
LLVVELSQRKHMALDNLVAGATLVFDHTIVGLVRKAGRSMGNGF